MTHTELRKLRLKLDITQRQMANKLGVSLPQYSLYERGKTPINKASAMLAEAILNDVGNF